MVLLSKKVVDIWRYFQIFTMKHILHIYFCKHEYQRDFVILTPFLLKTWQMFLTNYFHTFRSCNLFLLEVLSYLILTICGLLFNLPIKSLSHHIWVCTKPCGKVDSDRSTVVISVLLSHAVFISPVNHFPSFQSVPFTENVIEEMVRVCLQVFFQSAIYFFI